MILRRLAEALRRQDWFTVLIKSAAAAEGRIAVAYAEDGRLPEEGSWGVLRAFQATAV